MEEKRITIQVPTPREIKQYLDEFIIGQDDAKRVLSVAIYNHYKRIGIRELKGVDIEKNNIIVAGNSGCGKTAMIKAIAKFINVPCYIADATSITQAGYVGDDVETILVGLLRQCDYDVSKAEYGIIVIDEVDKLAKRSSNQNITRDVVGEGVQQALLKMVEGGTVGVPPLGGRKHPQQDLIYIDTTNILFIGLGAFVGLRGIIESRLNIVDEDEPVNEIGFLRFAPNVDNKEFKECPLKYMHPDDLKRFGMIPEFVGRFPILTHVDKLDKKALKSILTKPKNSIVSQYVELMEADGIKLTFEPSALDEIAEIADKANIGARGLKTVMDKVMSDFMFSLPGKKTKKLNITRDIVKEKTKNWHW